jgi:O-Antigen ligase
MNLPKNTQNDIARRLYGPDFGFYVFVTFLVIVFFTGGGSRDDIQSLVLLRPLAVLFCAYALTAKATGQWRGRSAPLYIAGALLALMLLQLMPLPPSIWIALPGRQIFADIANIAGIEQPWRPLTLSPSKTLNSLFSLTVPIAAMMLYLNLDRDYRKRAIPVIIILCSVTAMWAIFQIIGPAQGPLYTYRITNPGAGVGLFANRNHQAVVLASTIVMLGWYAGSLKPNAKQTALKFYISVVTILVFVPLIFITGSRAGLILMVPGLIIALILIYYGEYFARGAPKRRSSGLSKFHLLSDRRVILVTGIAVTLGIAFSSIFLSRSPAFDRLFSSNDVEELRIQLLPILFKMHNEYLPWGSGFGSFEHVYKIYEPFELLDPSYLNNAHNDWLQYSIEGGVPALVIGLFSFAWFGTRLWILLKNWRSFNSTIARGLMSFTILLFLLAASVGDYPLRVPIIMAIFGVIVCIFNDSVRSVQLRDISQH